jgi:hypothetical protein
MSIEAIKKALKKVYIGEWYISGVKTNGLSVVHNAADSSMFGITAETFEAEYICAANPFAVTDLISEIDRLQRENEALREALTPFSRVADMSNKFPSGGTVGVNVDRCRDARKALASTGGDHHGN